jgi:hypothetical protein
VTEHRGDVQAARVVRTMEQHAGCRGLWEPYIARWSEDHLVVAFGAFLAGKTDMGSILCSVSTDGGDNWGDPVPVFDHTVPFGPLRFAYANPVLYKPPDQPVVWCFAMRCPLHYRDSEDSDLCAAYSADGGRSWLPVEVSNHFHSPLIIVAGIERVSTAEGPRYLLPAHRNTLRHDPRGSQDQFVLESSNLLEWRLAGYVPGPAGAEVFLHEGNIAVGERDGELRIVMRTAQAGPGRTAALDPPVAYSSTSRDGGRGWSPAAPEPALHNSISKGFYGRDARGRHVYVYSVGPAWERRALAYKVRPPGGQWSEERPFFDAGVKNSYPTLIEDPGGFFHAVWDSSTSGERARTLIRYGRLTLA